MSSKQSCQDWSLVADIGGTNARFARKVSGSNQLFDISCVGVSEHENLLHALSEVLQRMQKDKQWSPHPASACFAVAARVDHDEISLLNSNWHFTRAGLIEVLKAQSLVLINDFAAKAYGVLELTAGDWVQVGGGKAVSNKAAGILGPGTGLGVSMVIPAENNLTVVDGEGGHVDFAPLDSLEIKILEILEKRFGRVSVERLLCGAGLINIYLALAQINNQAPELDSAEAISARGQEGDDPLSQQSLAVFCRVLGSVAGNLALTAGALGGIYITGSIVPGMLDYFSHSEFRQRFEDKGRFSDYLAGIPVRVVTRQDLGLFGAANKLTLSACQAGLIPDNQAANRGDHWQ